MNDPVIDEKFLHNFQNRFYIPTKFDYQYPLVRNSVKMSILDMSSIKHSPYFPYFNDIRRSPLTFKLGYYFVI